MSSQRAQLVKEQLAVDLSNGYRTHDSLEPETTSNANLMQPLDNLNQRYGRGTVKMSTQGAFNGWQMRPEHKSPDYTTCWDHVTVV